MKKKNLKKKSIPIKKKLASKKKVAPKKKKETIKKKKSVLNKKKTSVIKKAYSIIKITSHLARKIPGINSSYIFISIILENFFNIIIRNNT